MTILERFDFYPDVAPVCPVCTAVDLTGLQEVEFRDLDRPVRSGDHPRIVVLAEPCGCDVTEHAPRLQADAILLEHQLAEQTRLTTPETTETKRT